MVLHASPAGTNPKPSGQVKWVEDKCRASTWRAASRHFCMEISSGSPWYSGRSIFCATKVHGNLSPRIWMTCSKMKEHLSPFVNGSPLLHSCHPPFSTGNSAASPLRLTESGPWASLQPSWSTPAGLCSCSYLSLTSGLFMLIVDPEHPFPFSMLPETLPIVLAQEFSIRY